MGIYGQQLLNAWTSYILHCVVMVQLISDTTVTVSPSLLCTGVWGVSHTRVPTESRPGHVAIIAGLYEDVSAVTRGWQENPVEFDSVFNQSRHTWSWGSPDILPMFAKGAAQGRVQTYMYESEAEDFADNDASRLDSWVFTQVEHFFQNASREDSALGEALQEDGNIFFLHLLGIDTNGHAHKPASDEYQENIQLVDQGISRIEQLFEDYFNDSQTAYVFTADHGMTDWGSHGAGLPEETMTPLLAWGAGLRWPQQVAPGEVGGAGVDSWSEKWGLSHLRRCDVNQADIAPLMSVLIGRPIPLNNEGVLPICCLHDDLKLHAHGLFANAMQLCEQVMVKHEHISETSFHMFLRPYPSLDTKRITEWRTDMTQALNEGHYAAALQDLHHLVHHTQEAITYYNKYHRTYLFVVLSVAFVGWMASIGAIICEEFASPLQVVSSKEMRKPQPMTVVFAVFLVAAVAISLLLFLQSSPILHYAYTLMALFVWWKVVCGGGKAILSYVHNVLQSQDSRINFCLNTAVFCIFVEGIVVSFFHRCSLSILLLLVAVWPFLTSLRTTQRSLCFSWAASCCFVAVFPLLPTVGRTPSYLFVHLAVMAALSGAWVLGRGSDVFDDRTSVVKCLLTVQRVQVVIATVIVEITRHFIAWKLAIPFPVHLTSWFLLMQSPFISFFSSKAVPQKLLSLFFALFTPYVLLSNSYEALFVVGLASLLYQWVVIEHHLDSLNWRQPVSPSLNEILLATHHQKLTSYNLKSDDVRRVIFALLLGMLSFFGTGNIASINTFDPSYVYCFKTVFSPFIMGGLLILKIVIPFFLVAFAFNIVLLRVGQPLRLGVLLTLAISDVLGLHFFFLVRDEGSWLDIGISIGHYVIIMCVAGGVVLVMGVAQLLTGTALAIRKAQSHKV